MFLVSAYSHLAEAVLATIVVLYFYNSYRKSGHYGAKVYTYIFGYITLYTLALGLPLLFWPDRLELAAYGFILGTVFIILALIATTYTVMFTQNLKRLGIYRWSLGLIGAILVAILVADLRIPDVDYDSWTVLWNVNPIVGWILGLGILGWSILWFYLSTKNSISADDKYSKWKALMLGFVGLLIGISAPFYFTAETTESITIAATLMLATFMLMGLFFWILRSIRKR